MRLPNASHARVDREKIERYLLCHDHPDGASKARFFERFGFGASDWQGFAEALREHARLPVAKAVATGHGTRYSIDGPIRAPDGRRPTIRTVWIMETGSDVPRLITAYPAEPSG